MAKWRLATATLRRHLQSPSPTISAFKDPTKSLSAAAHQSRSYSTAQTDDSRGKWLTLPPFSPTIDGTVVGKGLLSDGDSVKASTDNSKTTALRWILRCRPDLPRTLVQKLFRLRQVRREMSLSVDGDELQRSQLKRVAAKESLNVGDRIYLPLSVDNDTPPTPPAKKESFKCSEEERKFVCSLVLYKDPAIIVLNKPHGLAVQGGSGIKTSIDELAATCLTFDKSESPRLVHRLDRDCSGLLVLARTQTAATVLHSIFREKTCGASAYGVKKNIKSLKRKYMALVIGCPRRQKGQISAPLRKVVVDDGKSDRITVNDNGELVSTQHAITEYKVIESSPHGYTWLELRPLTGRKHQLRVHCAEVLGTPILGDYKYGWQAHKAREPFVSSETSPTKPSSSPFGLDLDGGDVSSKQPHLHLHSKQIDLPNISQLLEKMQVSSDSDISDLDSLKFDAPLPSHMQLSFNLLKSRVETCDKN
ncbi:Pseudouridine synthase catalytic domain superfamily [Arabidopsis thaliana x Arabidopsis arenosa]|uniref:Pseudouridine synthase catalytic domain superfamily n=1 Tax=Arabidopsis thaliana x Arabidopsis arenosa TaxID=1240361 RepID=A0A8T2AUI7_9BRAS|nr:Pseudouridine synthase catalytic domain superfamily [Arabidopsis thaliana x Arabidopsis arenosa]